MSKHISNSLEETQKIADDFVDSLFSLCPTSGKVSGKAVVVGLYGELGAGKTAFMQCIAKALGVGEKVLSPTFVIMKIYDITKIDDISSKLNFDHLIHVDAYRMDSSDELLHLGWQEIISNPKNLILIEWPERVTDVMPEHTRVNLRVLSDENSREIEILE